jgi:branched-chain amino acid transport system substrate-binding protein
MHELNRRHVLGMGAAGAAALAAPGLALAQGSPVRIGALMPRQGGFALQGEAATLGAKIALEMAGNKVLGRPVELIVYDDPNPLGAQQNMRKLIQEDKVSVVLGGTNSASGLAMASYGAQSRVPTVITAASVRDITGKDCDPHVFRVNAFTGIYTSLLARHLLPMGKKWYFLVGAYAYGQEVYELMKHEVEAAGGKDVGMDATPIGTTDFSSLILKIRQAKPDVVVLGIAALDLASFLKQYEEFGLHGKIPLAAVAIGDEELWAMQSNPMQLLGKYWHFNDPANTPQENALVAAVKKATGHPPSQSCASGWVAMRMTLAGIENAKSLEAPAIVRGLEAARPAGVRGTFRAWDHQMIWQPVICQVRDKIVDKYDPVTVISKPLPPAQLEAMYGTKQQSACKMKQA